MEMQNLMRQTAANLNGDEPDRFGHVSGYDPSAYAVKVLLQPDGAETGWIPLEAAWVGNGWGMFAPPSIGDAVRVSFQEGSASAGIAGGRTFNDVDRPLAVESGECWLVHKQGSCLKLTNDGKVLVNSAVEIDATAPVINITATGNVNVVAPSISLAAAGQTLKSFITDAFIAFFNSHTHTTTTNGSPTSTPNQTSTAPAHATTTVKGG